MPKQKTQFYLRDLVEGVLDIPEHHNCVFNDLCSDSRLIKSGNIFIAVIGKQFDARHYYQQALEKGAVAIISDTEKVSANLSTYHGIPLVQIPNLGEHLSKFAARFFNSPSQQLFMIGITGTNGKTSISQFIAQCLDDAKQRCGIIGTLGNGFHGKLQDTIYTTPDAINLQRCLANLLSQEAKAIAMEVTSIGLALGRVKDIKFDLALFTNLTRDHLDFHQTMEAYGQAKQLLFRYSSLKYAVVNLDDEFSQQLLTVIAPHVTVAGYTIKNKSSAQIKKIVSARNIVLDKQGIHAVIESPWGDGEIHSHLLGRFNLSNLLGVITSLCLMNISFSQALTAVNKLTTVPGRMQAISYPDKPLVVVDYSHTPDALQKALQELRAHSDGEVWCVFGCGGDRDKGKRPLMGEIAEEYADHVVVTDDNPRTEDADAIISDIIAGIKKPRKIFVERDRAVAIQQAISKAQANDVILIAGKGHENYQIVGTERKEFSDIAWAEKYLKELPV